LAKKSLFDEIAKIAKKKNDYAFVLGEDNPYEVKSWTDTGCYILNAILSDGDIYKGILDGKRVMLSGESSTAKSLFTCFMIGAYLKKNPNSYAVLFETEGSSVINMAKSVGIPEKKMIIIPVATVEECRNQMVSMLDKIIDVKEGYETTITDGGDKKRKKIKNYKCESNEKFIFCIDSLGMLGTDKETGDVAAGKNTKDMTRAALLKAFARVTSLKLSIAQIPLIIVNHTYATFDKYNPQTASGGSGPAYMSDVHLMLFKSKEKEGKEQVGVKIRINVNKSRFMIEGKNVHIILHFKRGLYKYSNLVELAYNLGVLKKEGISFLLPDGTKAKMKDVRQKPSKYFNKEVLEEIQVAIKDAYSFGEVDQDIDIEDELGKIDGDNDEIVVEEDKEVVSKTKKKRTKNNKS